MNLLFRILLIPSQMLSWLTFSILSWIDDDCLNEVMNELEEENKY